MRATRAYIASLGTTGLLLAFSASLLVVVGTLFAFNAWPGADIRDAVDSLIVDEKEKRFGVAGPAQVALDSAPAALAVASVPAAGGTLSLDGGGAGSGAIGSETFPSDTPGGGFGGDTGGTPGRGGGDGGTVGPTGDPIDTGRETNQLADTTEGATRGLGDTIGGVNQQLGDTVSETGQALSDIVRDLPDVKLGGDGVSIGN
jgi:hypothetical protein